MAKWGIAGPGVKVGPTSANVKFVAELITPIPVGFLLATCVVGIPYLGDLTQWYLASPLGTNTLQVPLGGSGFGSFPGSYRDLVLPD